MRTMDIAGVIPAPNWNSAPTIQGVLASLRAADGSATTAGVTWSTDNIFSLGIANDPGDDRMMNGYLDPFNFARITVTGLP